MLKYIILREDLPTEYFCCGEILLINETLPVARILEIIKAHMDLK